MKTSTVRTLVTLGPVVVGSSTLGVVLVWLVRAIVPPEVLASSNDVVGNYLQTVGGIYAVLLAFVVFVVWTQFNESRTYVEREANELADLWRTLVGLDSGTLGEPLRRYVSAVLDEEWAAMAHGDDATIDRVGHILEGLWSRLHSFDAQSTCDQALHSDALARFHDLCDARTERLSCARNHIPLALWLLLILGAIVLVGSFLLLGVPRFSVHAIITGAMAGAVSHILYLIYDLDASFSGAWQVSRAPFERVRRFMDDYQPNGGSTPAVS
jgi:hypothetical protein